MCIGLMQRNMVCLSIVGAFSLWGWLRDLSTHRRLHAHASFPCKRRSAISAHQMGEMATLCAGRHAHTKGTQVQTLQNLQKRSSLALGTDCPVVPTHSDSLMGRCATTL